MNPPTEDEIREFSRGRILDPADAIMAVRHFTLTYVHDTLISEKHWVMLAHGAMAIRDTVRSFGERDGWRPSPSTEAKVVTTGLPEATAAPTVKEPRPLTKAALAHYAELCERPERWGVSRFADALRETLDEITRLESLLGAAPAESILTTAQFKSALEEGRAHTTRCWAGS